MNLLAAERLLSPSPTQLLCFLKMNFSAKILGRISEILVKTTKTETVGSAFLHIEVYFYIYSILFRFGVQKLHS